MNVLHWTPGASNKVLEVFEKGIRALKHGCGNQIDVNIFARCPKKCNQMVRGKWMSNAENGRDAQHQGEHT